MATTQQQIHKLQGKKAGYDKFCEGISSLSVEDVQVRRETLGEKEARKSELLGDYQKFFEYYFTEYATATCADYHIEMANNIIDNRYINQLNFIYRSGGKSIHANLGIPFYLMCKGEMKLMALIAYDEKAAVRLLDDIRTELTFNDKIINDYGNLMMHGTWGKREFTTSNGTKFIGFGLDQKLRGLRNGKHRVSYLSVDDCDNKKIAKNPRRVEEAVEKILAAARGAFGRDYHRFIYSNNFISNDGISAKVKEDLEGLPNTKIIQVNAVDEYGNPTWDYYTKEYWKMTKDGYPVRYWEPEFMNNPVNFGKVFKQKYFQYAEILPLEKYDQVLAYGDLAYGKGGGCSMAIVVLGSLGDEFHLIDCVVRDENLNNVIEWFYKWERDNTIAHCVLWIEGNASQKSHYELFFNTSYLTNKYKYIYPRWDLDAKGDKWNRIASLESIFIEGKFFFNERLRKTKDFKELLNQFLNFEVGTKVPVDAPDAFHGAFVKLNKAKKSNLANVLGTLKMNFRQAVGF